MSLPVYILKIYKEFFSIWLTELINLSFETGIFPDNLKIAKGTQFTKKIANLISPTTDPYLYFQPLAKSMKR